MDEWMSGGLVPFGFQTGPIEPTLHTLGPSEFLLSMTSEIYLKCNAGSIERCPRFQRPHGIHFIDSGEEIALYRDDSVTKQCYSFLGSDVVALSDGVS